MKPPTTRLWRTARVWERSLDAVLVLTAIVEIARLLTDVGDTAEVALAFIGITVAAFRRAAPITVMSVLLVLSGVGALFDPVSLVGPWVTAQVGLFSLALRSDRRAVLAFAPLFAITLYIVTIVNGLTWVDPTSLAVLLWTAAVAGAALALRAQHDAVEAEVERADSLLAAQDSAIARRLTEERIRIARDLHDSVAHGISSIALQTSAIEVALDEPALAREHLRAVRSTARSVLDETQQVLQLLREGEGAAVAIDVTTVLEDADATGDDIVAEVDPRFDAQPDFVRVSLAKILREALTNARRHGQGSVNVRISADDEAVELVVTNRVPARRLPGPPDGFGLRGVRERAEAMRGRVTVRRGGDQFALTVRVPITAEGMHT